MNIKKGFLIIFSWLILGFGCSETNDVWLDALNIQDFSEGISSVAVISNTNQDSIKIGPTYFTRGIGIRYVSVIPFYLDGNAKQFTAEVGLGNVPEDANPVKFYAVGDKKILFESEELKAGDAPQHVDLNLKGIERFGLLIMNTRDGGNRALAYWANARFKMLGNNFPQLIPNAGEKYILTPPEAKEPQIHSAKVYGATPGNPFLYRIAATGLRPMTFSSTHLPKGLDLDASTGIISGKVAKRDTFIVDLEVKNEFGEARQKLRIIIGDTIALTPPMGWNGWNAWVKKMDQDKVMNSVNAMVTTGLINHGWSYINLDDTWEGKRGGKFNAIQPNEKFPDFQEMIDDIHAQGLKFGVYSTPWICTYQGYPGTSSDFKNGVFPDSIIDHRRAYHYFGKYSFETNDAEQMAEWGVDYLKYDWHIRLPSEAESMSKALRNSGRDIVYSLSNHAPFEYASAWQSLANLWRTGGDIRDSWISLYSSAFTIDKWAPYSGPGHRNDPDMMVLGNISTGAELHPTRLTPDEQYSHMSIFCLLAAPLIIGCPVEQLNPFTMNLLSNDEVLEIDQDPLGKPARLVKDANGVQIWLKPMEDGSFAAGLFNVDGFGETPQSYFRWGDETPKDFTFDLTGIGLKGKWKIRDVWRQQDLGEFEKYFKTTIPYHGVVMVRMFPDQ